MPIHLIDHVSRVALLWLLIALVYVWSRTGADAVARVSAHVQSEAAAVGTVLDAYYAELASHQRVMAALRRRWLIDVVMVYLFVSVLFNLVSLILLALYADKFVGVCGRKEAHGLPLGFTKPVQAWESASNGIVLVARWWRKWDALAEGGRASGGSCRVCGVIGGMQAATSGSRASAPEPSRYASSWLGLVYCVSGIPHNGWIDCVNYGRHILSRCAASEVS